MFALRTSIAALLLLLLWIAIPAHAHNLVPITSVSSLVVASPTYTALGGCVSYSWRVWGQGLSNTTRDDVVEVELAVKGNRWVAMGFSPTNMDGVIMLCYNHLHLSTPVAKCAYYIGASFDIFWFEELWLVNTTTANGTTTFVVRFLAPRVAEYIYSNQRMILATGDWNVVANKPVRHVHAGRVPGKIDLYRGTSTLGEKYTYRIVSFCISFVMLVLGCIFGNLLKLRGMARTFYHVNRRDALPILAGVLSCGLVWLHYGLAYKDFLDAGVAIPHSRALGWATALNLIFTMLAAMKKIGPPTLSGSSWERMVPIHLALACQLLGIMTIHMAINVGAIPADYIWSWSDATIVPPAGFIAWLCTLLIIPAGIFLRRVAYGIFRAFHLMYFLVIVFAIVHSPRYVGLQVGPFLLWYMIDLILRVRRAKFIDLEVAPGSKFHEAAALTEVHVVMPKGTPPPSAGQFTLVAFSCCSGVAAHPITVAWYDVETCEMVLFIMPQPHRVCGKEPWSAQLALAGVHDEAELGQDGRYTGQGIDRSEFQAQQSLANTRSGEVRGDLMWTLRKRACAFWMRADLILVGCEAQCAGWFGSLQVPIGTTERLMITVGGSGASVAMSMLRGMHEASKFDTVREVVVLWSVRDTAQVKVMAPYFKLAHKNFLANCKKHDVRLEMKLFVSGLRGKVSDEVAAECQPFDVHCGRANCIYEVAMFASQTKPRNPNDSHEPTDDGKPRPKVPWPPYGVHGVRAAFGPFDPVSVYSCGPPPFMSAVREGCEAAGGLLHEETFIF